MGDFPPPAAGGSIEHVIDNSDPAFYTEGDWKRSVASSGFQGQDYLAAESGSGNRVATWNLNIIKTFDIYAKWTTHPNRGSDVKYVIHHLDDRDNLVTDTVTVDQRENGGEWFKLGSYRMSALTGRVTVSDNTDGYAIADAILFRELGVPGEDPDDEPDDTADSDGDGLPDEWERRYGLDPNDPSDASGDLDNDGLSNRDEFVSQTNPTEADTDSDGMPDGYEVDYGLDPSGNDRDGDDDGDGLTNYQEYLADSDPGDRDSGLTGTSVLLTWNTPTEREDGTPLGDDEIVQYEIAYSPEAVAGETVIDNQSDGFVSYGSNGFDSSSTGGYQGGDYFTMPEGSGESSAEWRLANLSTGVQYALDANWTSHPNRASNATYEYTFTNDNGSQTTDSVTVDQREGGGNWQELGTFKAGDSTLTVRITNDANGYVIADAVRINPVAGKDQSIVVDRPIDNSYVIKDLAEGEWQFKIRAIDSEGLKSNYSDVQTRTVD
ncbi:hypothetical protein [Marinobacter sp.]|uniref:golvesin C-terminal-like domain-containing protein n=1 Tax=Marinobacter sp. TaxID=50741 RepID=UPI0034A56FD2